MASFNTVTAGNPTYAADINQLINALNGTTSGQVVLLSGANNAPALINFLPSTPAASQDVVRAAITGDTSPRSALYIRSDGYGGVEGGNNAGISATWYATSTGWKTDQSVAIVSALTVGTTLTVGSSMTVNGNGVMLFGSGTGNPRIFTGTTTPTGAVEGDIWIKA